MTGIKKVKNAFYIYGLTQSDHWLANKDANKMSKHLNISVPRLLPRRLMPIRCCWWTPIRRAKCWKWHNLGWYYDVIRRNSAVIERWLGMQFPSGSLATWSGREWFGDVDCRRVGDERTQPARFPSRRRQHHRVQPRWCHVTVCLLSVPAHGKLTSNTGNTHVADML